MHISHGYNDFWYLKTFFETCDVKPNIVVIRYNRYIPNEKAITVPFSKHSRNINNYHTCSLLAISKILHSYRYIGDSASVLSYWIRKELPNAERFTTTLPVNVVDRKQWDIMKGAFWVNVQ